MFDKPFMICWDLICQFLLSVKLVWEFLPHPEHPGWTLVKDTISSDFSYGMKYFITSTQKWSNEELLQALQKEVEQLNPK